MGALTLTIPLVLSATIFHTAHIKNVRLFGFFFWLAMSWCGLLFSYLFSWFLGYCWFYLCQKDWFVSDGYETFVVDIRHSTMLFLWAIISWALVPLFCVLDHRQCTDQWVSDFRKAMLGTFILAFLFFVKGFFEELVFIETAMESMKPRQDEWELSFYAIIILLQDLSGFRYNTYEWIQAMRTWSKPDRSETNILEQANPVPEKPQAKNPQQNNPAPKHTKSNNPHKADPYHQVDEDGDRGSLAELNALADAAEAVEGLSENEIEPDVEGDQGSLAELNALAYAAEAVEGLSENEIEPDVEDPIDDICLAELNALADAAEAVEGLSENEIEEDPSPLCIDDIFEGKGSEKAYNAFLADIKSNPRLRPWSLQDTHQSTHQGTHQSLGALSSGESLYGLSKTVLENYWKTLHHAEPDESARDEVIPLLLHKFPKFDILWKKLNVRGNDNFVSFDDLKWLITYGGDNIKEVVDGQKNIKKIVNALDIIISIILGIVIAFVYAAIFTKDLGNSLIPVWTAFTGVSFAIQDPVKELISACVFVFAQHPYDVGDYVLLVEDEKDHKLIVKSIYLMHTTFERVDNERVVHIPHSKIGKECIENLSRTRMFSHNVVLPLEPKNAPPDISELQGKLAKYCLENKALLAALLFHEMPKVSLKDEDVGEKGKKSKSSIQIEFRMKRRIPRTLYKQDKEFRNCVQSQMRILLKEKHPRIG